MSKNKAILIADRIVFIDDISYICKRKTEEKHNKNKKDSYGNPYPKIRYEIVVTLKSNGNLVSTWYDDEQSRDSDFNELVKLFIK